MPKISIILPVYNVEKYLRQCLDSIVSQTFTDFECICVNDGSTDNSLSILEEYSKKDNRFKVISQENKGLSGARNVALRNSSGEYITFVDSDDWLDTNCLYILYNTAIENNSDLVRASYKMYYQKDNIYESARIRKIHKINDMNSDLEKIKNGYDGAFVCSKFIKTELLKNNDICFYEGKTSEDCPFMALVFLYAKNITFIKDELYYYRKQINSITSNGVLTNINSLYQIITLTKDLEYRKKLSYKVFNLFCVNKFLYKIGSLDGFVPKERENEIFLLIKEHLDYLKKISKIMNCMSVNLKLFLIEKILYTKNSFKLFRVVKNIIK